MHYKVFFWAPKVKTEYTETCTQRRGNVCSLFSTVTENYQFVQITKGKWKFECLVSHVTENKFETFFLS